MVLCPNRSIPSLEEKSKRSLSSKRWYFLKAVLPQSGGTSSRQWYFLKAVVLPQGSGTSSRQYFLKAVVLPQGSGTSSKQYFLNLKAVVRTYSTIQGVAEDQRIADATPLSKEHLHTYKNHTYIPQPQGSRQYFLKTVNPVRSCIQNNLLPRREIQEVFIS